VQHTPYNQQQTEQNVDIRAEVDRFNLQPEGATQCVATDDKNQNIQHGEPLKNHELMAQMNFLYQEGSGMSQNKSMQVAIKRVLQEKIFKSVKFLPRNTQLYKYADFVNGMKKKDATVTIVNGVLHKLNLSHYNVQQKTRFWITYNEYFRQLFTEHRSATQECLKRIFFDTELGELLRICFNLKIKRMYSINKSVCYIGLKSANSNAKKHMDTLKNMVKQEPSLVPKIGRNGTQLLDKEGQKIFEESVERGGLLDLRHENNSEVLEFVMLHCFKAPLMRQAWDYDSKLKCVSTFVTVYDEALTYLMIENNLLLWDEMNTRGVKSRGCAIGPKYTSDRGRNIGWSTAGLKRFNTLYRGVKGQREKGLGYEVEKIVLNKNSLNRRANMVGAEDGAIEVQEEEEAAFEIMD
jgi:hypothetical protein